MNCQQSLLVFLILVAGIAGPERAAARGERGSSLGATVSTISADDLGSAPMESIAGALRGTPGLTGTGPSLTIRGIGGPGNASSQPLYVVDGVQTSRPPENLDPAIIDRIEVVNGAAAVSLYGSAAANGVVLINTKPQFEGSNPTGSAALPGVQDTLADYLLAIQSTEQCDASNGALLPVPLWFPGLNYGVGDFSSDRSTQYWGDVGDGFSESRYGVPPAIKLQPLPFSPSGSGMGGGPGLQPQLPSGYRIAHVAATTENLEILEKLGAAYEAYLTVMGRPLVSGSEKMMFAIAMLYNYAAWSQAAAGPALANGLLDPKVVFRKVTAAYDAQTQTGAGIARALETGAVDSPSYRYFQEMVEKLLAHPSIPDNVKMESLYGFLFSSIAFQLMISDQSYALGLFNPDLIIENVVSKFEFQQSTQSFTEFFKLYERIVAHGAFSPEDKLGLTVALLFNHAAMSRDRSDAAYALGMFDPDVVLDHFVDAARGKSYGVIPANSTIETIDIAQQWLDQLEILLADPNLTPESRKAIISGVLFYSIVLGQLIENPADVPADVTGDSLLQQFFAIEAAMSPEAYTRTDPFSHYALPPPQAFDFKWCTAQESRRILTLIRERDAANDTANQMWDYYRHPDTSKADQVEATTIALDAEAMREQKNLEIQQIWRACTKYEPALPDAEVTASDPKIDVRVYKDKAAGLGSTEGVPGIGVDLRQRSYGNDWSLPFSFDARRDEETDAGIGSSLRFTDGRGIAWSDTPQANVPATPPDRELEGSTWNIKADYKLDRLTLNVPYQKIDSVVHTFPGFGGKGLSYHQLPDEVTNQVPEDLRIGVGAGFSIGNNFYVPYTYAEDRLPDLSALDGIAGTTWSNNFCGEAALPPQGAGYLSAAESPVKSVSDRWALEHVGIRDHGATGSPVIVGIIDTGIDWNHADIAWDNLWRNEDEIPGNGIDDDNNGFVDDLIGWDFTAENNRPWDYDGHGTFVAGLIAATRSNDIGIDGINPNAKIMVLKALNNFGRTRASYVARAIVYGADNGARILNLSIAGPGFPPVVQDAINYANAKGVLVVVAAGNRAEDLDRVRPAALRNVMTVAATDVKDLRAAFSNVGSAISVAAPGVDVVSLRARATDFMYNNAETSYVKGDAFLGDDNRYYRAAGTSFATPIVAGVASLVWSQNPSLDAAVVRRIVEQSAKDIELPGRDRLTGYGLVDAAAALAADPAFYIQASIDSVSRIGSGGQAVLRVSGSADANLFAKATLEIGQGENPTSWMPVGDSLLTRVNGSEIGRIPVDAFSAAGQWTVRLVVEHATGRKREARYLVNIN